jgi:hypothetical protein
VLVEAVVAAALTGIVMSSLATASSVCMGMLRAQRETVGAATLLEERLEQFRAGGWTQVTDATALSELLGHASTQEAFLDGLTETVTVSTYPAVTPAASPLKVARYGDGSVRVLSTAPGFSLRERLAVRVDLKTEWTSRQNRRARSRETSTVMSLGGMLR